MGETLEILQRLKSQLRSVRTKEHVVRLTAYAQLVTAAAVAIVSMLVVVELFFGFSSTVRTGLALLVVATAIASMGMFLIKPALMLFGAMQDEALDLTAKRVGNFFPDIRDRLLNALQLEHELTVPVGLYSSELLQAALQDLGQQAARVNFIESVDASSIQTTRRALYFSLAFPLLLGLFAPSGSAGALMRLWNFDREFIPPAKYLFEVSPGNAEAVKGSTVAVGVRVVPASGSSVPDELQFFRRSEGQESFEQTTLKMDSSGEFHASIPDVRTTTEYLVRTREASSPSFRLTVLDRPLLRSLHARLDYPAYTGLPPRVQDEFIGDVSALEGTRVTIAGAASKPLRSAEIAMDDQRAAAAVRGETFNTAFVLRHNGSYTIALKDEQGLQNVDPVRYGLQVLKDEAPTVAIVDPGKNLDVAGNESLPLLIQAKDDFGFSKLQLEYRLVNSRYEQAQERYTIIPITIAHQDQQQLETIYAWDLPSLHLAPEDVVEYLVEVFDNDAVSGPKSAKSLTFQLRLPSLDEVFADAKKTQDESIDDLKESLKEAEKLKEQVEEIRNDLKKNKDLDWTKQKKLEEMAKRYQDVQKKMDEVGKKLEDATQQMNQQNVLSKETLEKYLELQNVFQQMNTAELQKALQKMQQPMQNLSKEAMQQAMKQVEFSEEKFRQSIERTLNLLKRIQIEQTMDEVTKRADDLAKQQEELAKQTSTQNDPAKQSELAKQQSDLAKQEQHMEQTSADLQKKMEEFYTEMPSDELQKMNEEMKSENVSGEMQKAAQQMQSGQKSQAQQSQQKSTKSLQQFSQKMSAMQQQMLQNQAQAMMNELRRASTNLLELSKEQESIKQQAQNAPPNSPQLRENQQRQQQALQNLNNVTTSLSALSQKSFVVTPEMGKSIGEAVANMGNAMRDLDVRNGSAAAQDQQAAMGGLNSAAIQVQNALQSMMQQGGGSGAGSLMQQLQMMAGQQQSLNAQTQQLPGQGQMSMQQAAEAARLSKEQDAVRKSLEELNKEAQKSEDGKRVLGDLQKIAEEMREVVRNLEQQNVNPETIQKQERILSRLLDASKSQRERDFEKKRKAESGTQVAKKSPGELDPRSLDQARLRQDLLKLLEQKYSKDYRELVRRYFEELDKIEDLDTVQQ